jgi:amino acid adenylation domain-containing protein
MLSPSAAIGANDGAAMARRDVYEPVPLSFAQQRLWFLDQLEPGGSEYLIRVALNVSGPLDAATLETALSGLAGRHEVLRTRFPGGPDGQPVQVADLPARITVLVEDLAGASPETVAARVDALAGTGFDLAAGPLWRAALLRTGPERAVLVICLHHIVFDGWSEVIFARELAELYRAATPGREPAVLPELPVSYADYAIWQRDRLSGPVLERHLGYWRERLAGLAPLNLPTDHPRRPGRPSGGGTVPVTVDAATVTALRRVAGRSRATLFMALQAALAALLSRYCGQDDIAIGTPVAGRSHTETENMVGLFVNTMVLRTDASGDPSFTALVRRVKDAALGAYDHQDLPFERLVEDLAPARDLSRNPLFQTMLVLQTTAGRDLWSLPGLELSQVPLAPVNAQLDLSVELTQQDDKSLKGFVNYDSDLFDRATAERLAGHLRMLLAGFAADPEVPLSQVEMLTPGERDLVVRRWNDTARPWPSAQTMDELVRSRALACPDATAVVCGDTRVSFAGLIADADRLARLLRDEHGATPGTLIGVFLDRSPDMVTALLAIMITGAAFVPLDPDYPAERLRYMLDDTAAPLVITQRSLAGRLPAGPARLVVDEVRDQLAARPPVPLPPLAGPADLAYVIYTSGSTGRPKGVMVEHAGIVSYLSGMQDDFPLRPGDSFLQATPLTFDVSVYEIFWPLWQGATVVLVPGTSRVDMEHVGSLMRRHRVTGFHFVPSLLDLFVSEVDPADCAALRYAFCSGEALPPLLVRRFAERFGGDLINLYGATEVSVDTTYWRAQPDGPVLAGRPMSNQAVYVLDDALRPVPPGVVGEIYLGGQSIGRGYLGRPELTADRFRPDPFAGGPDQRMYKTGDLGRLTTDGQLDLLGRIDSQVKLRGVRIEPTEIEAVLLGHDGVVACTVMVRDDGQGKRLVAYCVPAGPGAPGNGTVDVAALRARCQRELPAAMVPAVFVTLAALPLTPNGKVDRGQLPAPDAGDLAPRAVHVPPRDEIEQALAGVWAGLLGLDRVGVHDNFFEVGGHSLRAVQLVNQVERLTGMRISLRGLFTTPSIAGIKTQLLELVDAQK